MRDTATLGGKHSLVTMNGPIPEDEDEQLRLAIALSMQADPLAAAPASRSAENAARDGDTADKRGSEITHAVSMRSNTVPLGIHGMDRRAMEQERLARLARAQERDATEPEPGKRFRTEDSQPSQESLNRSKRRRSDPAVKVDEDSGSSAKSYQDITSPPSGHYPNGVVKRTWAFGFERTSDDIKLEEVLQKNTLQLAVLSALLLDFEWVLKKLEPSTKVVLVVSAKENELQEKYTESWTSIPRRRVRMCFPPMPGNVNCMHSKLMLLAHPGHLRVVVPTANLVPFDWGETGVMENTVFIIDLPRRADGGTSGPEALTAFGQELWHFCEAMGLAGETLQSLGNFDFAATKDMAFVHAIGGEHRSEDAWRRTGYPGLGRAVRQLGLHTDAKIQIDFVASSIGALTGDFLQMLYLACKGDDGLTEYQRRTKPKTRAARIAPDEQAVADATAIRDGFRIYFPSEDTVRQSKGGPPNGGTVCFQQRWYDAPTFQQSLLHECRSTRTGLLMHNKILYVQEATTPSALGGDASSPKAWAYVGSANCSESAWGRLVKDRTSKLPKLTCRNWECGVLLPVPPDDDAAAADPRMHDLRRFAGTVPVPMQLPAKVLVENDLRPWFFNDAPHQVVPNTVRPGQREDFARASPFNVWRT